MADEGAHQAAATRWLALAAVAGALHTTITLYWAFGGKGLLWTMGASFIAKFSHVMWVLFPLALFKGVAALAPLLLHRHRWPFGRVARAVCWLGTVVLVVWGGANTVVGNAVLAGFMHPDGGYDRSTMIGHAWLWDPLFLVWGLFLGLGLWASRQGGVPSQR